MSESPDSPSAPLLVREAKREECSAARSLLVRAGWEIVGDGTMLVVFDPCEQSIRGAAVARQRCHCTYELVAWAVDAELLRTVDARLVRAVADRLRQIGARRVIASVVGLTPQRVDVLRAVGFDQFTSTEGELLLGD